MLRGRISIKLQSTIGIRQGIVPSQKSLIREAKGEKPLARKPERNVFGELYVRPNVVAVNPERFMAIVTAHILASAEQVTQLDDVAKKHGYADLSQYSDFGRTGCPVVAGMAKWHLSRFLDEPKNARFYKAVRVALGIPDVTLNVIPSEIDKLRKAMGDLLAKAYAAHMRLVRKDDIRAQSLTPTKDNLRDCLWTVYETVLSWFEDAVTTGDERAEFYSSCVDPKPTVGVSARQLAANRVTNVPEKHVVPCAVYKAPRRDGDFVLRYSPEMGERFEGLPIFGLQNSVEPNHWEIPMEHALPLQRAMTDDLNLLADWGRSNVFATYVAQQGVVLVGGKEYPACHSLAAILLVEWQENSGHFVPVDVAVAKVKEVWSFHREALGHDEDHATIELCRLQAAIELNNTKL